jgi:hypothetical protein
MSRSVIIHCHIFKNAGHTFDRALKNNFGDSFLVHRDTEKMKSGAEYLGPFISENPKLKALSSHHIRFPLPEIQHVKLLPAIILRHPVDRLGSVYLYEQKYEAPLSDDTGAKKISFQKYILQQITSERNEIINNFQTRFCLEGSPQDVNEREFKLAFDRIRNIPLLGLADYYDESLVLFEEVLRPYYPDIDLSYAGHNITLSGEKTLDHRVRGIFDALGLEALDAMLAYNHWDLMLYLETKEIIRNRMQETPGFTARLNDFYRRCLLQKHVEIRR